MGTCTGCPKQQYATGEPGKVQGRDHVYKGPVGIGPAGSVFGENSFYQNIWCTRHEDKRTSIPRVAYPKVKI